MGCRIIAFEGGDCIGKETQSKLLAEHLNTEGKRAVRVEMPWPESPTHDWIRTMLANGSAKSWPYAFQTLQLANKLHFQYTLMKQLMESHDVLVLDRWDASTWVYGQATGVDTWTLNLMMNRMRAPDVRILLHGSSYDRGAQDSYEADDSLQSRVRKNYDNFATATGMWHIDGNQSIEAVHGSVLGVLNNMGI